MEPQAHDNTSVLGRLLDEISWEGANVRGYRDGGRGRENVLTAEVLTALDFLPRRAFLGAVLDNAHGADRARHALSRESEDAEIVFLPDEVVLNPDGRSRGDRLIVQPDAVITTPAAHALVEAKKIGRSSFQPQQLAREYLAVTRQAGDRTPLLLLILGTPPPVLVTGHGRMPVHDAIAHHLPTVHALAHHPGPLDELIGRIPDVCAWTTWHDLTHTVTDQHARTTDADPSTAATIARLVTSITHAVARHS
ncbi:hypothetical protein [Saccharothrix stipae]